jgi:hypothetical protein
MVTQGQFMARPGRYHGDMGTRCGPTAYIWMKAMA